MIKFYIDLWKMEKNARRIGKDITKIGDRTNKFVGGFVGCISNIGNGVISVFKRIRGK